MVVGIKAAAVAADLDSARRESVAGDTDNFLDVERAAMKIPKSKAPLISMLLMVMIMTFVVVFVSTAFNHGLGDGFVFQWMRGWGIAFVIAFPTVLIIMPSIRKFVDTITR